MARPDARQEADIAAFTREVETALGDGLLCLALHGSAAGEDWVAGRSDVNTVLVVRRVTFAVLERLGPVVARWRTRGFALPVVLDEEYLARARDTFPMELDDVRRQHRLLAGRDLFAGLVLEPAAIRRECEREARGKLLRLRAAYLETAGEPTELARLMVESVKSFLLVLRYVLRLRAGGAEHGYQAVLGAGEAALGPLPTVRRLLDHRERDPARTAGALAGDFGAYLAEVERIVAAVDGLDA